MQDRAMKRRSAVLARAAAKPAHALIEELESRQLLSGTPTVQDVPIAVGFNEAIVSWEGQKGRAVEGRWLVGLSDQFRAANKGKSLEATSLSTSLSTFSVRGASLKWSGDISGSPFAVVDVQPEEEPSLEKWAATAKAEGFTYVEPDWLLDTSTLPGDADFGKQWALNNTGQTINSVPGIGDADIDGPEAWGNSTGSGVIVAVIDTGVNWNHVDLNSNIWSNPGEIAGDGIDNDANGKTDDTRGWDFWSADNDPNHGTGDTVGHGTEVAGVVGAELNGAGSGTGIVGVSYGAKILPLRVGYDTSIDPSLPATAINYAVDLK